MANSSARAAHRHGDSWSRSGFKVELGPGGCNSNGGRIFQLRPRCQRPGSDGPPWSCRPGPLGRGPAAAACRLRP